MATKRFHDWIGLSGVDADENEQAQLWAKRLELPLLLMAFWILLSWYWDSTTRTQDSNQLLDWSIWVFFVCETSILCYLVNDKRNYLENNWLNLAIIICGIPILWGDSPHIGILRGLRLLIFLGLMVQLSRSIRIILARNHLGATLMVSSVFIIVAGYLIAGIDPAIKNPVDGIWWAWVTATTVGYGDIVPVSIEGRILGGILILLGICLLSLITANTSVFFISNATETSDKQSLAEIEKKLDRIEKLLEQSSSVHINKSDEES